MLLTTARTLLLPWQPEDWLSFRQIAADPEVMRYIGDGRPWPDERVREFVTRQIENFDRCGYCLWKLVLKETGKLGGFCGLQPRPDVAEVEIGWWLARAHWGRGLATEAAREALRDGFERLGLDRIVAIAQPANRASIRVMEKLGMRHEADTTSQEILVVLYSITRPLERAKSQ